MITCTGESPRNRHSMITTGIHAKTSPLANPLERAHLITPSSISHAVPSTTTKSAMASGWSCRVATIA